MPSFKAIFISTVLYLMATLTLGFWFEAGRAIAIPDAVTDKLDCVSYSPFHRPGQTPFDRELVISPEQIKTDLSALSRQFGCIRTYSVDQGLDVVPAIAQQLGMQVWLGVWIGRDTVINNHEIEIGTRLAQEYPNTLRGLIVGNEVLMRREQTPAKLREVLAAVRQRAPHTPISYADSWDFWLRYQHELADSVDFATIHILPFWDDDTVGVAKAAEYVADTYTQVKTEMHGKSLLIGETGWPSYGRQRQDAAASQLGQAEFIRRFSAVAKTQAIPYNIIEAFDQPWKRRSEGAVGGYWGIFSESGESKFPLRGPVAEAPQWRITAYLSTVILLLGLMGLQWRNQTLNSTVIWVTLPLSISGAGSCVAYWRDFWMTNRNGLEWAYSGFFALALLLVILGLCRQLNHSLFNSNDDQLAEHASQIKAFKGEQAQDTLISIFGLDLKIQDLRRLFLFAAAVVCLLLVFDLRNRDYPLALFSVPATGWFLLALLRQQTDVWLEEKICAVWIGFAGLWLPVIEHLIFKPDMSAHFADGINPSVFYWAGICLLLSASVLLDQSKPE